MTITCTLTSDITPRRVGIVMPQTATSSACRALCLLLAALQPCETMRLPLGAHRSGEQQLLAATRQINALLSVASSWRSAAVAFTMGCTLLIARGILARRWARELHRLAQRSPVLKASKLSLPSRDDQGWEAWRAAVHRS